MVIFGGKLVKYYIKIFMPILIIRYLPLVVCFYFSKNRIILEEDLKNFTQEYGITGSIIIQLLWAITQNPYWITIFYYRIGNKRAFICSLFKKDKSSLFFSDVELGKGIKLYHPFATILNAVKIGDNFVCRNNTTIGNKDSSQNNRPVIGNNVEIGANVVIFGNICIGDNVIIGAGSVVNKSIPNNCIVVGNPAKIIKYKS